MDDPHCVLTLPISHSSPLVFELQRTLTAPRPIPRPESASCSTCPSARASPRDHEPTRTLVGSDPPWCECQYTSPQETLPGFLNRLGREVRGRGRTRPRKRRRSTIQLRRARDWASVRFCGAPQNRGNWLHVVGGGGLKTAAVLLGVCASATRLRRNPWSCLRDVLEHLAARPAGADPSDLADLPPDATAQAPRPGDDSPVDA